MTDRACQICRPGWATHQAEALFDNGSRISWHCCEDCARRLLDIWVADPNCASTWLSEDCECPNRGTLTHAISHGYWPGGES